MARRNAILSVRSRGITLAVQRAVKREHKNKSLAMEAHKKIEPVMKETVNSHYRQAISDLRWHLRKAPTAAGPAFRVTAPSGRRIVAKTPPWAPLSDKYRQYKEGLPGEGAFWILFGGLLPAVREALMEGFGARLERVRYHNGRVESHWRFQRQDPRLDDLIRRSFVLAEPQRAIYTPDRRWRGLDKKTGIEDVNHLNKLTFFESGPGSKRPQLYRPMLGYIMAAHGRMLHEALRAL